MSVTIESDLPTKIEEKLEPCLCSQMADGWTDFYNGIHTEQIKKNLKQEANQNCPFCKGEGIEISGYEMTPRLNLANRNAEILFKILGVNIETKNGYVGEMTISEARRCIMRAQSKENISKFVIPETKTYGKPIEISPGVYNLKPLRFFDLGLTEEQIHDYISRFANFVIEVSKLGATKIFWS